MAHKFESGLFFGENAWHGLGVTLPADSSARYSIDESIKIAGLDWSVSERELFCKTGGGYTGPIDGWKAIERSDTGAVLGVVGERYRCLQNRQQFDWFKPFLDSKAVAFETCGALKGGTIVWVLAKVAGANLEIAKDDTVAKYLLLTSSHDGSMATNVGFCPIRVVCWNTLTAALHSGESQLLKVRHTESQHDTLKQVRDIINTVNASFEATADQYRNLAARGVKLADLRKYVKIVLDVEEDETKLSTRQANIINRVVDLCTNGTGQNPKKLTLWGAYNGITQYITHEAGNGAETRLRSAWYGPGSRMNERALKVAMSANKKRGEWVFTAA